VAEIIKSSRGLLSDKTLIENHPFVDNVSSELARIGVKDPDENDLEGEILLNK